MTLKEKILLSLYGVATFLLGGILMDVVISEPLKGFQIGTYQPEVTIEKANSYGARLIRYQIVDPSGEMQQVYESWWYSQITNVIAAARFIDSRGFDMKLIVDMHTPPCGTRRRPYGVQHRVLNTCFDEWVNLWVEAIVRIESSGVSHVIYAYEPINEPAAKSTKGLFRKYRKLIKILRKFTDKPFILSHKRRGIRDYLKLEPLKGLGELHYTSHVYKPNALNYYQILPEYSSTEKMQAAARRLERRGKAIARRALRPLRKFQRKHGVTVYVGEYGVSARVPDPIRVKAVKTFLGQMNRWQFNWTWHALDEHPLWQPYGETLETIKNSVRDCQEAAKISAGKM